MLLKKQPHDYDASTGLLFFPCLSSFGGIYWSHTQANVVGCCDGSSKSGLLICGYICNTCCYVFHQCTSSKYFSYATKATLCSDGERIKIPKAEQFVLRITGVKYYHIHRELLNDPGAGSTWNPHRWGWCRVPSRLSALLPISIFPSLHGVVWVLFLKL